jgi:hypothetical protein
MKLIIDSAANITLKDFAIFLYALVFYRCFFYWQPYCKIKICIKNQVEYISLNKMLSFFAICDTEDQQLTFIDLFFFKFESSLSWVRLELFDEKTEPKNLTTLSL